MGKQTEFQYDELQMFFGDDYKVSDYITIHQPTVGEDVYKRQHLLRFS